MPPTPGLLSPSSPQQNCTTSRSPGGSSKGLFGACFSRCRYPSSRGTPSLGARRGCKRPRKALPQTTSRPAFSKPLSCNVIHDSRAYHSRGGGICIEVCLRRFLRILFFYVRSIAGVCTGVYLWRLFSAHLSCSVRVL